MLKDAKQMRNHQEISMSTWPPSNTTVHYPPTGQHCIDWWAGEYNNNTWGEPQASSQDSLGKTLTKFGQVEHTMTEDEQAKEKAGR